MNFLGINNYNGLNYNTFSNSPDFFLRKKIKNKCNLTNTFQFATFHFNISQILQYMFDLYQKNNKKIPHYMILNKKSQTKDKNTYTLQILGNSDIALFTKTTNNGFVSFRNEYLVGVYGTNYLRIHIPNFSFYYCLQENPKSISVSQEFIVFDKYIDFIEQKYQKIYFNSLGNDFLSILLQVLCALEYAQNTLQFTHYDFHFDNLLLRKNTTDYSFSIPLFHENIEFQKPRFISTITDLGFSSIQFKKNNIISNCDSFPQFGYHSFFNSSIDMTRILFGTYDFSKYYLKKDNRVFHRKMVRFCEFIFEKFYNFNINLLYKKTYDIFQDHYCNFTGFPQVYKTPYELFQFILNNEDFICSIFDISQLPINITKTKKTNVMKSKEKKCLTQLLCISDLDNSFLKNNPLNNFYNKDYKLNLKEFKKKIENTKILTKNLPLLRYNSLFSIDYTIREFEWFIEGYEKLYYDNYIKKDPKNIKFFRNNIMKYSKVYKNLTTLKQFYQYYMLKYSSIDKDTIEKYENDVSAIFN